MLEFDDEAQVPAVPSSRSSASAAAAATRVNTMIEAGVEGVDFIVANTDCQVLEASLAGTKVHLGRNLTKGLGAGANPEIGTRRRAGGRLARRRGAAAAPTWCSSPPAWAAAPARARRRSSPRSRATCGALTVGVVTKPFAFEGSQRKKKAIGRHQRARPRPSTR